MAFPPPLLFLLQSRELVRYFYKMAVQQLDLFGNPVPIPVAKEEKVKVAPAAKASATPKEVALPTLPLFDEVEKTETTAKQITTTDYTITAQTPSQLAETGFVYSDNQIRVKIKPKKEVAPENESPAPPKKKRGRKKSPPREFVTRGGRKRSIDGENEANTGKLNIPDDEALNKKMYWGITEVAIMFGVNNSLIRYWTNEFAILQPRKGKGSHRLYRTGDIKTLQLVYDLLRVRKFSIEGAKKYLATSRDQIEVHSEVIQSLNRFKTFLMELKTSIEL